MAPRKKSKAAAAKAKRPAKAIAPAAASPPKRKRKTELEELLEQSKKWGASPIPEEGSVAGAVERAPAGGEKRKAAVKRKRDEEVEGAEEEVEAAVEGDGEGDDGADDEAAGPAKKNPAKKKAASTKKTAAKKTSTKKAKKDDDKIDQQQRVEGKTDEAKPAEGRPAKRKRPAWDDGEPDRDSDNNAPVSAVPAVEEPLANPEDGQLDASVSEETPVSKSGNGRGAVVPARKPSERIALKKATRTDEDGDGAGPKPKPVGRKKIGTKQDSNDEGGGPDEDVQPHSDVELGDDHVHEGYPLASLAASRRPPPATAMFEPQLGVEMWYSDDLSRYVGAAVPDLKSRLREWEGRYVAAEADSTMLAQAEGDEILSAAYLAERRMFGQLSQAARAWAWEVEARERAEKAVREWRESDEAEAEAEARGWLEAYGKSVWGLERECEASKEAWARVKEGTGAAITGCLPAGGSIRRVKEVRLKGGDELPRKDLRCFDEEDKSPGDFAWQRIEEVFTKLGDYKDQEVFDNAEDRLVEDEKAGRLEDNGYLPLEVVEEFSSLMEKGVRYRTACEGTRGHESLTESQRQNNMLHVEALIRKDDRWRMFDRSVTPEELPPPTPKRVPVHDENGRKAKNAPQKTPPWKPDQYGRSSMYRWDGKGGLVELDRTTGVVLQHRYPDGDGGCYITYPLTETTHHRPEMFVEDWFLHGDGPNDPSCDEDSDFEEGDGDGDFEDTGETLARYRKHGEGGAMKVDARSGKVLEQRYLDGRGGQIAVFPRKYGPRRMKVVFKPVFEGNGDWPDPDSDDDDGHNPYINPQEEKRKGDLAKGPVKRKEKNDKGKSVEDPVPAGEPWTYARPQDDPKYQDPRWKTEQKESRRNL